MPSFSGSYEIDAGADAVQSGVCSLTFDDETLRLAAEKGPGLALDLGDIDTIDTADYRLSLKLYDGTAVLLSKFGRSFEQMRLDLLNSWRARLVQCLLLEDLEEVTRIDGFAQLDSAEQKFASAAEIRLYKSNIAVLPESAAAFQWRLADIDAIEFDEATYTIAMHSGDARLNLSRLARRGREFNGQLLEYSRILSDKSAQVIRALFPFLTPGQFVRAAALMKEGRAIALSDLAAISPSIEQAIFQNAVGPAFRHYFSFLKQRAATPGPYFGFKFLRKADTAAEAFEPEDDQNPEASTEEHVTEPLLDLGDESLFCWFMIPVARDDAQSARAVAWECTSQSWLATYLFRLPHPAESAEIDAAIRQINRGIVMVNFRREPIYLPDSSLELQPRWRRYAIARRSISALRNLRNQLIGRAIHSSMDKWKSQLQSLVEMA